jgi:acyl-CoA synthetase (AMP-forming)/AMP-acid ligase II
LNVLFFPIGDLAGMHLDRYAKIKVRFKDVIISDGENIYLRVEEVIYGHPDGCHQTNMPEEAHVY